MPSAACSLHGVFRHGCEYRKGTSAQPAWPDKSKSRSNNSCKVRAEGEQKPSGAVERASHDDARPTGPTAYTLKGINALSYFNSRAGEEKGGLEGKTPVLPSGVPRYCIPTAACSL